MMGLINTMKSEGWQKGVPDYIIVTPTVVLFLELKRVSGSVVSDEQKAWITDLQGRQGVQAVVAKGFSEAKSIIDSIIS